LSSWHSKTTALTVPVKTKVALLVALGLAGLLLMLVSGASAAESCVAMA